ncbi:uncharacterized protein DFL_008708 [Arthrobotrys flagrans]|uniref:Uncharacterized protein n=1 Tax=Arthrobotrys flagrans TaxID=97331 RepID=A0A436ZPI8_ARTFL|nr:hypothetical protein DFL_008708 [Arthrobotrys flagrans]
MKVTAIIVALAAVAAASPVAEPSEIQRRSCKSNCSSLASNACTKSCKGATSPSCHVACYNSRYPQCLRDYC